MVSTSRKMNGGERSVVRYVLVAEVANGADSCGFVTTDGNGPKYPTAHRELKLDIWHVIAGSGATLQVVRPAIGFDVVFALQDPAPVEAIGGGNVGGLRGLVVPAAHRVQCGAQLGH